eukprot:g742.t1
MKSGASLGTEEEERGGVLGGGKEKNGGATRRKKSKKKTRKQYADLFASEVGYTTSNEASNASEIRFVSVGIRGEKLYFWRPNIRVTEVSFNIDPGILEKASALGRSRAIAEETFKSTTRSHSSSDAMDKEPGSHVLDMTHFDVSIVDGPISEFRFGVKIVPKPKDLGVAIGKAKESDSVLLEESFAAKIDINRGTDDDVGSNGCSNSSERDLSSPGVTCERRITNTAHFLWFRSPEIQVQWTSFLLRAAVSEPWPDEGIPFESLSGSEKRTLERTESFVESLLSASEMKRRACLTMILRHCSVLFRFDGVRSTLYRNARFAKTKALGTVLSLCRKRVKGIALSDRATLQQVLKMIACNLFRCLPKESAVSVTVFSAISGPPSDFDAERGTNGGGAGASASDGEVIMGDQFVDPSWPHLHLCYEITRELIICREAPLALKKKLVTSSFVARLVEQFKSKDRRERAQTKLTVHRMYGTLTTRRAPVRRAIKYSLFEFLYEEPYSHPGIIEILDFLLSIVNGFGVPLRKEHKDTLERCLLPLHKAWTEPEYHDRLQSCMVLFASKDPDLAPIVITSILRFWPRSANRIKEQLFWCEIESLFEFVTDEGFAQIERPLADRVIHSLRSDQVDIVSWIMQTVFHGFIRDKDDEVDTRAITRRLGTMSSDRGSEFFSRAVRVLEENSEAHWNGQIRDMSRGVLARVGALK